MESLRLVLASASPRRAELLRNAGIRFVVRPAHVKEERRTGEAAADYVRRMAVEKAEAVECGEDELELGADTTVVAGDEILEKPQDAGDARRMLALLSGRVHEVITGVCLRRGGERAVDTESTRVRFLALTAVEIEEYVATGEPFDKAGAYAIQGWASRMIDRVEGCYFNVVGLPVSLVWRRMKAMGY
jgi:septum formation protein